MNSSQLLRREELITHYTVMALATSTDAYKIKRGPRRE